MELMEVEVDGGGDVGRENGGAAIHEKWRQCKSHSRPWELIYYLNEMALDLKYFITCSEQFFFINK